MGSQLRWLERAPDKREVDGSSPFEPTSFFKKLADASAEQPYGGIAQLGERLPCKQEAIGSIPIISTNQHIEN